METEQKITSKSKSKWLIPAIIAVGIIFLGLGTWAGYNQWIKLRNSQQSLQEQPKDEFTVWQTYQDEKLGFELKYPKEYGFYLDAHPQYSVGEFFIGAGENIITVDLPKSLYAGTNFYAGFLTVSAAEKGVSIKDCAKLQQEGAVDFINMIETKIKGKIFYKGEANGAAAGTFSKNIVYHAFDNDTCYEVSLNLFQGNIGNYPEGTVSQVNENDVWSKLKKVLSTFKFIETKQEFCGQSTKGSCNGDTDCMAGGCSGQVCQSKSEEPIITTCEYKDCYNAKDYNLICGCKNNQCQWK